jgi:hypothetical protein
MEERVTAGPMRVVRLEVQGLGILLYSPFAAEHIQQGEDYLSKRYSTPTDVVPQILAGALVGFGTGSPGVFLLRLHSGYPSQEEINSSEFRLRLAVEVRDDVLCVRDLYDLLDWDPSCPPAQKIGVASGYYHVTLCSAPPESGILGDDQTIDVFLHALPSLPSLKYDGVPILCS